MAEKADESIRRTVKGLPHERTLAQSLMRRGSYQIDRRHPTTQVCTSFGEFKARGGIKLAGAFLSGAQSSSPSSELDLVRVDCKRQSRIVNCLLHKTCQIQSCATCLGACDYHLRPPLRRNRIFDSHASQTQLTPPPIGKNLPDSVREFYPILGTFPRKVH